MYTNEQTGAIGVGFDHTAEHERLRTPTPSLNPRSSHLPLWFSSISGTNIPRVYLIFLNMFRKFVSTDL